MEKKNLIIAVLSIVCIVLGIVAVHAAEMSKSLMADSIKYQILQKDVQECSIALYDVLTYNNYGERLLPWMSVSVCDDGKCVNIDGDGIFVSEFYKEP